MVVQEIARTFLFSSCLFPSAKAIVLLQYEKNQYHITHQLGRFIRRAAAHGVSPVRQRLICSRGQDALPHEVERPEGAGHSASPQFPHLERKRASSAQYEADTASHLSP